MIDVVSIKFKNRGKAYFFDPGKLEIKTGEKVIVETSKGLEIADCCHGNHAVMEDSVVQPLRPVVRIATADDLRVTEINKKREKEAFEICQQKIAEHGLDMKLVDVECNFEGSKTMFFFTSDGRVDFRDLVKDLAGIFRNRIELRQIGVRDEAKMIGGIGICGRPYCCNQFLDDFQPVSTKMAKVQSLSLNPTKISGSCGRLMCCLRYEQDAYENLLKKVPKQGAFVETKDGYGTAVQVNLLRQTVKVKLDDKPDDTLSVFKANELATVPGGRPKEGEPLPKVLQYVPEPEEEEEELIDEWAIPMMVAPTPEPVPAPTTEEGEKKKNNGRRRSVKAKTEGARTEHAEKHEKHDKPEKAEAERRQGQPRKPKAEGEKQPKPARQGDKPAENRPNRRKGHAKPKSGEKSNENKPKAAAAQPTQIKETARDGAAPHNSNRRRNPYRRPRRKPGGEGKAE